ncbi:MAG: hypothetical protein ACOCP8_02460 [archaeon]
MIILIITSVIVIIPNKTEVEGKISGEEESKEIEFKLEDESMGDIIVLNNNEKKTITETSSKKIYFIENNNSDFAKITIKMNPQEDYKVEDYSLPSDEYIQGDVEEKKNEDGDLENISFTLEYSEDYDDSITINFKDDDKKKYNNITVTPRNKDRGNPEYDVNEDDNMINLYPKNEKGYELSKWKVIFKDYNEDDPIYTDENSLNLNDYNYNNFSITENEIEIEGQYKEINDDVIFDDDYDVNVKEGEINPKIISNFLNDFGLDVDTYDWEKIINEGSLDKEKNMIHKDWKDTDFMNQEDVKNYIDNYFSNMDNIELYSIRDKYNQWIHNNINNNNTDIFASYPKPEEYYSPSYEENEEELEFGLNLDYSEKIKNNIKGDSIKNFYYGSDSKKESNLKQFISNKIYSEDITIISKYNYAGDNYKKTTVTIKLNPSYEEEEISDNVIIQDTSVGRNKTDNTLNNGMNYTDYNRNTFYGYFSDDDLTNELDNSEKVYQNWREFKEGEETREEYDGTKVTVYITVTPKTYFAKSDPSKTVDIPYSNASYTGGRLRKNHAYKQAYNKHQYLNYFSESEYDFSEYTWITNGKELPAEEDSFNMKGATSDENIRDNLKIYGRKIGEEILKDDDVNSWIDNEINSLSRNIKNNMKSEVNKQAVNTVWNMMNDQIGELQNEVKETRRKTKKASYEKSTFNKFYNRAKDVGLVEKDESIFEDDFNNGEDDKGDMISLINNIEDTYDKLQNEDIRQKYEDLIEDLDDYPNSDDITWEIPELQENLENIENLAIEGKENLDELIDIWENYMNDKIIELNRENISDLLDGMCNDEDDVSDTFNSAVDDTSFSSDFNADFNPDEEFSKPDIYHNIYDLEQNDFEDMNEYIEYFESDSEAIIELEDTILPKEINNDDRDINTKEIYDDFETIQNYKEYKNDIINYCNGDGDDSYNADKIGDDSHTAYNIYEKIVNEKESDFNDYESEIEGVYTNVKDSIDTMNDIINTNMITKDEIKNDDDIESDSIIEDQLITLLEEVEEERNSNNDKLYDNFKGKLNALKNLRNIYAFLEGNGEVILNNWYIDLVDLYDYLNENAVSFISNKNLEDNFTVKYVNTKGEIVEIKDRITDNIDVENEELNSIEEELGGIESLLDKEDPNLGEIYNRLEDSEESLNNTKSDLQEGYIKKYQEYLNSLYNKNDDRIEILEKYLEKEIDWSIIGKKESEMETLVSNIKDNLDEIPINQINEDISMDTNCIVEVEENVENKLLEISQKIYPIVNDLRQDTVKIKLNIIGEGVVNINDTEYSESKVIEMKEGENLNFDVKKSGENYNLGSVRVEDDLESTLLNDNEYTKNILKRDKNITVSFIKEGKDYVIYNNYDENRGGVSMNEEETNELHINKNENVTIKAESYDGYKFDKFSSTFLQEDKTEKEITLKDIVLSTDNVLKMDTDFIPINTDHTLNFDINGIGEVEISREKDFKYKKNEEIKKDNNITINDSTEVYVENENNINIDVKNDERLEKFEINNNVIDKSNKSLTEIKGDKDIKIVFESILGYDIHSESPELKNNDTVIPGEKKLLSQTFTVYPDISGVYDVSLELDTTLREDDVDKIKNVKIDGEEKDYNIDDVNNNKIQIEDYFFEDTEPKEVTVEYTDIPLYYGEIRKKSKEIDKINLSDESTDLYDLKEVKPIHKNNNLEDINNKVRVTLENISPEVKNNPLSITVSSLREEISEEDYWFNENEELIVELNWKDRDAKDITVEYTFENPITKEISLENITTKENGSAEITKNYTYKNNSRIKFWEVVDDVGVEGNITEITGEYLEYSDSVIDVNLQNLEGYSEKDFTVKYNISKDDLIYYYQEKLDKVKQQYNLKDYNIEDARDRGINVDKESELLGEANDRIVIAEDYNEDLVEENSNSEEEIVDMELWNEGFTKMVEAEEKLSKINLESGIGSGEDYIEEYEEKLKMLENIEEYWDKTTSKIKKSEIDKINDLSSKSDEILYMIESGIEDANTQYAEVDLYKDGAEFLEEVKGEILNEISNVEENISNIVNDTGEEIEEFKEDNLKNINRILSGNKLHNLQNAPYEVSELNVNLDELFGVYISKNKEEGTPAYSIIEKVDSEYNKYKSVKEESQNTINQIESDIGSYVNNTQEDFESSINNFESNLNNLEGRFDLTISNDNVIKNAEKGVSSLIYGKEDLEEDETKLNNYEDKNTEIVNLKEKISDKKGIDKIEKFKNDWTISNDDIKESVNDTKNIDADIEKELQNKLDSTESEIEDIKEESPDENIEEIEKLEEWVESGEEEYNNKNYTNSLYYSEAVLNYNFEIGDIPGQDEKEKEDLDNPDDDLTPGDDDEDEGGYNLLLVFSIIIGIGIGILMVLIKKGKIDLGNIHNTKKDSEDILGEDFESEGDTFESEKQDDNGFEELSNENDEEESLEFGNEEITEESQQDDFNELDDIEEIEEEEDDIEKIGEDDEEDDEIEELSF